MQTNTLEKKIGCDGAVYWIDAETKQEYSRIVAGLQWPGRKRGFCCVLGESEIKDPVTQSRNFYVLAEIEDVGVQTFIEKMHEAAGLYCLSDFYGDASDRMGSEFLYQFNLQLQGRRQVGFYISRPPLFGEKQCFPHLCQAIFSHLRAGRKTLHFGPASKLPSYLLEFGQEQLRGGKPEDFPAIAALGYALTALSTWTASPQDRRTGQAAITDYDVFGGGSETQDRDRDPLGLWRRP